MPNHGVPSGAGSTTSTLGPRQEWGKGYYVFTKSPLTLCLQQPSPASSLFLLILNTSPELTKLKFSYRKMMKLGGKFTWRNEASGRDGRHPLVHLTVGSEVTSTAISQILTSGFGFFLFPVQLQLGETSHVLINS